MRLRNVIPWVAILVLGFILFQMYGCNQRRVGELAQRVKARDSVIAALARVKAQVDTKYVKGRTVYLDARADWDSLKIVLGDKAKLDPAVLAGNRLAEACDSVVRSCDQLRQISDSIIAEQTFQIQDLKKGPGWFKRTFGCAAGIAATTKSAGLGAACGIRFP